MISGDLTFHHLGLAVKRRDRALKYFAELDYEIGDPLVHEDQQITLTYCSSLRMPDVEIISPLNKRRNGGGVITLYDTGLYHQCYETSSIQGTVINLQAAGMSITELSKPEPSPLFDDRLISYLNVAELGLVELLEVRACESTGQETS